MKSRWQDGRAVRNFMTDEERKIYKRFLPEHQEAKVAGNTFSVGQKVHGIQSDVEGKVVKILHSEDSPEYRQLVERYRELYGLYPWETAVHWTPPFYVVLDEATGEREIMVESELTDWE